TRGHSERVALAAARLAQQLRLPVEVVSDVYFAGLLHDIGTLTVPEGLLLKPERLTTEEQLRIKEAPAAGAASLGRTKPLERLRPAVRHQHEWYDGHGYPDRLAGDTIPLTARILSVAESCDAMLSPRPYRPALASARVEAVLAEGAGRQWDPEVVEAFMVCRSDLYPICTRPAGRPLSGADFDAWAPPRAEPGRDSTARTVAAVHAETVVTRR